MSIVEWFYIAIRLKRTSLPWLQGQRTVLKTMVSRGLRGSRRYPVMLPRENSRRQPPPISALSSRGGGWYDDVNCDNNRRLLLLFRLPIHACNNFVFLSSIFFFYYLSSVLLVLPLISVISLAIYICRRRYPVNCRVRWSLSSPSPSVVINLYCYYHHHRCFNCTYVLF